MLDKLIPNIRLDYQSRHREQKMRFTKVVTAKLDPKQSGHMHSIMHYMTLGFEQDKVVLDKRQSDLVNITWFKISDNHDICCNINFEKHFND